VSIGFGLWAGFPVVYPYSYYYGYYDPYYAYGYPYPYPYGYPAYPGPYPPYGYGYGYPPSGGYPSGSAYPPASSYPSGPSAEATGGVSFEITPATAEVYVDGSYMGTVGQFTPSTQPLGLPAGRHHIEIRAPGYRTMDFDADIVPGQVIPYQGTLQP
jgi:hypothetical protein